MNNAITHSMKGAARVTRALGAAALGLTALSAQAVVGSPTAVSFYGSLDDASYGTTGNLFELVPFLFVNGLGKPSLPTEVVVLNPGLTYSAPVLSGFGTGLATVEYRITNVTDPIKNPETFSDLRFLAYANPDGNPDFIDTVKVVPGSGLSTDPAVFEVRDYFTEDALDTIVARFVKNKAISGGVDAVCLSSAGCDAQFAMQWNAATLAPGESFVIRIGLSDTGASLSSAYLQALSTTNATTQLTFSGTGQVMAVPEPSTWVLLMAGLGAVAWCARGQRA